MNNHSNIWTPSNCLSKSQLIGYIQQKLDTDEVYLIESHLNDCTLCSDALDGLMNENIETTQELIAEIKSEIEEKIKLLHPPEKSERNSITGVKTGIEKGKQSVTFNPLKKYQWLVAASILLLISLGGYSVYSYIKSQQQALAQNHESSKVSDADYKKPENANANEITSLQINPSDSFHQTPKSNSKNEKVSEAPAPANSKQFKNLERNAMPAAPQKQVPVSSDYSKIPEANEKVKEEKPAVDETISPNQGVSNYYEDKKINEPQKEQLAKKKSSGGMSNSKYNNAPGTKQLSYPPQQNNTYNSNNTKTEDVPATELANTSTNDVKDEISDYENAMQYYSHGEYKKSIRYFEKALKTAEGNQKEDIQFQLANAYHKTGKNSKAEKLFEVLALGKKYKTQANEQLLKAKK